MNAKEINLGHKNVLTINIEMDWNTWNETEKLILFTASYTEKPIFVISWWSQSPLQELDWIIKSEHVIVIFDVVLCQEIIYLFAFIIVFDVYHWPVEAIWDVERFSSDVVDGFYFIDLFIEIGGGDSISFLWNRLRVPEVMSIIKRSNFGKLFSRMSISLFNFGAFFQELS